MPGVPKPLHKHLADGTFRADRHGNKEAIQSDPLLTVIPPVPRPHKTEHKTFQGWWDYYAQQMIDAGILVARDLGALTMLCDAHEQLAKADAAIKRDGLYLTTEKGGTVAHPAVVRRENAKREIFAYQKELSLTVRARATAGPVVQDRTIPVAGGVTGRRR